MGCNYFAIPIPSDEIKDEIRFAININNFKMAQNLMPEKIHIGKSSSGWWFLFNHNNEQWYKKNRKDIESFLIRSQIFDEYDNTMTPDEFWKMVDIKSEYKPELEYGQIFDGLCFSNFTEFS